MTQTSKKLSARLLAFASLLSVVLLSSSAPRALGEERCETPEGTWLYTVTIPPSSGGPIVFSGTETYDVGGGYSEADELGVTPYFLATPGHEQKGKLPEAIEVFKQGLALEGNTELWGALGHAYAVSGNLRLCMPGSATRTQLSTGSTARTTIVPTSWLFTSTQTRAWIACATTRDSRSSDAK